MEVNFRSIKQILQKHVLSLDGPVVTASGSGDELAVVTHSSSPLASGEQVLTESIR